MASVELLAMGLRCRGRGRWFDEWLGDELLRDGEDGEGREKNWGKGKFDFFALRLNEVLRAAN